MTLTLHLKGINNHSPQALNSTKVVSLYIYTKDNINGFEREDLKKIDDCFEAIWVEIKNDKTKNIICGCIYRHPNSDTEIFDNYI